LSEAHPFLSQQIFIPSIKWNKRFYKLFGKIQSLPKILILIHFGLYKRKDCWFVLAIGVSL